MHVHILGVCGTFMGGVAALARAAGHRVTGSDANVYPPMSDRLAALGVTVQPLDDLSQFDLAPDIVVVGNVMRRGMPAVEYVLDQGLRFTSGPQWLAEHVLADRRVIAVAGTHGKTTTASLVTWLLESAGERAGFLIGGVPNNFGETARLGDSEWFVVEADEYDTAFFDKRSKFVHYGPEVAVLNNVEFDHADIFSNLAMIKTQFHHLVRVVPGRGTIVANADDANVADVLEMGAWTPVVEFGTRGWRSELDDQRLRIEYNGATVADAPWSLPGLHNASNAAAACAAVCAAGVDAARLNTGLASFSGVRRRAETIGPSGTMIVIDDFAHHPTAIRQTIDGVRSNAAGRVIAVVELRSNTMRSGVHASQLDAALGLADRAFICAPEGSVTGDYQAPVAHSPDRLLDDVVAQARAGDTIVVMSNGGFANFSRRLAERLNAASPG